VTLRSCNRTLPTSRADFIRKPHRSLRSFLLASSTDLGLASLLLPYNVMIEAMVEVMVDIGRWERSWRNRLETYSVTYTRPCPVSQFHACSGVIQGYRCWHLTGSNPSYCGKSAALVHRHDDRAGEIVIVQQQHLAGQGYRMW
jgi:hypothetical protein